MLTGKGINTLASAAANEDPVFGLTHNFYRYPARFSPAFASSAIRLFSKPGHTILDPYMGGGTTIVEALASGRNAIGSDINPLAVFITQVKTTKLRPGEKEKIVRWATKTVPKLKYNTPKEEKASILSDRRTKNLNVKRGRFIKKVLAVALFSLGDIPTQNARDFVRCAILKTAQWALDGRRQWTSLSDFRLRLKENVFEMLSGLLEFEKAFSSPKASNVKKTIIQSNASRLHFYSPFSNCDLKADLVVTSPPYPGIHVLYHRWQIDGRKESPAPYWIAGCQDGHGGSYYTFGCRKSKSLHSYFESSLQTLRSIREVMKLGAYMVQMIAFANPEEHLPLYLKNMENAGFVEELSAFGIPQAKNGRIWRFVPNRRWHASLKGNTKGSKEVVLIHIAK